MSIGASPLPVKVPGDLQFLLASTGASADTRALVGEVLAFAQARPGRWRHHVHSISEQEAALRAALESGDGSAALEAVRRYENEHRGRNTILGKIAQLT